MLRAGRDIEHLQQQSGLSLHTLADCVKAIDKLFDEYVAGSMIASKIGVAYQRSRDDRQSARGQGGGRRILGAGRLHVRRPHAARQSERAVCVELALII